MAKKQSAYEIHEAEVIKGAEMFVACDFRGDGVFARAEAKDIKAACKAAEALIEQRERPSGRGCLVYAIKGERQIVVATIKPPGVASPRFRVLPTTGAAYLFDVVDEGTGGANDILCSTSQAKAARIAKALNIAE